MHHVRMRIKIETIGSHVTILRLPTSADLTIRKILEVREPVLKTQALISAKSEDLSHFSQIKNGSLICTGA